MSADELVPGPTAAQFDIASRLAWLGAIVLVVVAAVLASVAGLVVGAVAVALIVTAIGFGVRSSQVARAEREHAYSTLFDFPGYALRHPRTKQLLRAADAAPLATGRRSVFRSMLSVKPGTLLARRFDDDDRRDEDARGR